MIRDSTLPSPQCVFKTAGTPLVSVVLVNWNRCEDILANISALRRQHFTDFEVIVVDNGSTDDSVRQLERIPDISLVILDDNLGPAKGRNEGLAIARGTYVCFLDSDAFLGRKGLRDLVHLMDAEPTVGVVGCRVMNFYSRKVDQWIYPLDYNAHGREQFETYSFSAAGAFARTKLLNSVGGFWDRLFIYNEEVELSIKIFRAGYRVIYTPRISVYHKVSPAGRTPSASYFYLQSRNWIWIFYRHYPWGWRLRKLLQYICVYLLKGVSNHAVGSVFRGLISGLRETSIVLEFPSKMTTGEVKQLEALNRRRRLRLGR
jgi:GT2 family glycosyltransferase